MIRQKLKIEHAPAIRQLQKLMRISRCHGAPNSFRNEITARVTRLYKEIVISSDVINGNSSRSTKNRSFASVVLEIRMETWVDCYLPPLPLGFNNEQFTNSCVCFVTSDARTALAPSRDN